MIKLIFLGIFLFATILVGVSSVIKNIKESQRIQEELDSKYSSMAYPSDSFRG